MNKTTASMLVASTLFMSGSLLAQDDPAMPTEQYPTMQTPPAAPPPVDETMDETSPPITSNDAADIANEMQQTPPATPPTPVAPTPATPPATATTPPTTGPATASDRSVSGTAVLPQTSATTGAAVSVTSSTGNSLVGERPLNFAALDKDGDGLLSRSEVDSSGNAALMHEFASVDTDRNGRLSPSEIEGWTK